MFKLLFPIVGLLVPLVRAQEQPPPWALGDPSTRCFTSPKNFTQPGEPVPVTGISIGIKNLPASIVAGQTLPTPPTIQLHLEAKFNDDPANNALFVPAPNSTDFRTVCYNRQPLNGTVACPEKGADNTNCCLPHIQFHACRKDSDSLCQPWSVKTGAEALAIFTATKMKQGYPETDYPFDDWTLPKQGEWIVIAHLKLLNIQCAAGQFVTASSPPNITAPAPTADPVQTAQSKTFPKSAIIGTAVGGGVVVGLICFGALTYVSRRRRTASSKNVNNPSNDGQPHEVIYVNKEEPKPDQSMYSERPSDITSPPSAQSDQLGMRRERPLSMQSLQRTQQATYHERPMSIVSLQSVQPSAIAVSSVPYADPYRAPAVVHPQMEPMTAPILTSYPDRTGSSQPLGLQSTEPLTSKQMDAMSAAIATSYAAQTSSGQYLVTQPTGSSGQYLVTQPTGSSGQSVVPQPIGSIPARTNTTYPAPPPSPAPAYTTLAPAGYLGSPASYPVVVPGVYICIANYAPINADEIPITVGDVVQLHGPHHDAGWGFGENLSKKCEGLVPMACLKAVSTSPF